tara:strand:+ start:6944 stop:7675 length:732 start_codon:yes stop_codon:yes gene_type:complete
LNADNKISKLLKNIRSILVALLVALLIRYVFYQPFRIPSKSMLPNLLVGDHLLANRIGYGTMFPCSKEYVFNPVNDIQRGDVVIFHWPGYKNSTKCPNGGFVGIFSIFYIKRVIGVPGDTIELYNNSIIINGEKVSYPTEKTFKDKEKEFQIVLNKFDNKNVETIYSKNPKISKDYDLKVKVPLNMYFVLGDNRDNSLDSRFWGFVPRENIIGVPSIIHFSWDSEFESFKDIIRIERFFKTIE